jgi:DNA repair protein RadC
MKKFEPTIIETKTVPIKPVRESKEKNYNEGHRKRVKERILESKDISHLQDYELLELILFFCNKRKDVKNVAKKLLDKYANLANIMEVDESTFIKTRELGDSFAVLLKVLKEFYARTHLNNLESKRVFEYFDELLEYLQSKMCFLKIEQFRVLYLDANGKLIKDNIESEGTLGKAAVYTREIVKKAISLHASSVILSHNHPNGNPKPSKADMMLTAEVISALNTIDVIVQDHIIITKEDYYSFKKNNLI